MPDLSSKTMNTHALTVINSLISTNKAALLLADEDLVVYYATPQAQRLLDPPQSPPGQHLASLCYELVGVEALLADIARGKRLDFSLQHINRDAPENGLRYISMTVYATPTPEGEPGLLLLIEDTTNIGHLLQGINQSRNEIRMLKEQLTHTNQELETANRFKGLLLATISHEIRNRLVTILGYSDILSEDAELPPDQHQMLRRINLSAERLSMSLSQLINLDRIERDALKLELQTIDLVIHLNDWISQYPELFEDKFNFQYDIQTEPCWVSADPTYLQHVIFNLISNAINYTPAGGYIQIGMQTKKQQAIVWVENSGPGIQPDEIPMLFEPYFRGTNAVQSGHIGFGLGLFIVKSILSAHTGRVEASSQPGKTTRFTIYLPANPTG